MAKSARDVIEILAAILLGLVSVATALGAYQASVWAGQASHYASVSNQMRDRNLSEALTTQLIYRDDGSKMLDLIGLDSEMILYPERTEDLLLEQQVMLQSSSPELRTAWLKWAEAGYPSDYLPLTDPAYEAALFAETQSLQYGSYVADQLAEQIGAKSMSVAIASVVFAIALFLLGVAGVNLSWRIAAVLTAGATVAFVAGILIVVFALV